MSNLEQTSILFELDPHLNWSSSRVRSILVNSSLDLNLEISLLTSHPRFDTTRLEARFVKGVLRFGSLQRISSHSLELEAHYDSDGEADFDEIMEVVRLGNGLFRLKAMFTELEISSAEPTLLLSEEIFYL